jgi:hypothetical protein
MRLAGAQGHRAPSRRWAAAHIPPQINERAAEIKSAAPFGTALNFGDFR